MTASVEDKYLLTSMVALGHTTVKKFADACGISVKELRALYKELGVLCKDDIDADDNMISLDASLSSEIFDDHDISSIHRACLVTTPEQALVLKENTIAIDKLLSTLSQREEYIVRLHILGDKVEHTLRSVGKLFDFTQERIR